MVCATGSPVAVNDAAAVPPTAVAPFGPAPEIVTDCQPAAGPLFGTIDVSTGL